MLSRVLLSFCVAAFVAIFAVALYSSHVKAGNEQNPRFEHIYTQQSVAISGKWSTEFQVWRDKDTGSEFVCAYGGGAEAVFCWPTGRNWK